MATFMEYFKSGIVIFACAYVLKRFIEFGCNSKLKMSSALSEYNMNRLQKKIDRQEERIDHLYQTIADLLQEKK